ELLWGPKDHRLAIGAEPPPGLAVVAAGRGHAGEGLDVGEGHGPIVAPFLVDAVDRAVADARSDAVVGRRPIQPGAAGRGLGLRQERSTSWRLSRRAPPLDNPVH